MKEKIFDQLKKKYGSHNKAAKALGVSPRAYLYWRQGSIPDWRREWLEFKVNGSK